MTTRSRWLIFLVSTPLVALVTLGGVLGATVSFNQQGFPQLRAFQDVISLVLDAYVEEVDVDRVMDGAMRGLADSLDPASAYLMPDEARLVEHDAAPPAGEVGVVVTRQFYLRVVGVRDGSPAASAGLRTGDYIRAIDEVPTRDMSAITGTRLLRGEPGSTVRLLVIRGNAADPHEIAITRKALTGAAVESTSLADGLARVRVASFEGAVEGLRATFGTLVAAGTKGVIIDLRGTADGAPELGIEAARLFVKDGTIATLASRSGEPVKTMAAPGDGALTLPVVVLVSNGTAHAAELFAAALADNDRAELVGQPTAGLAARQHLVALPQRHALWLTYARYLSADGTPIHEQGLIPDVGVAEPFVDFGEAAPTGDAALDKAIERLKAALSIPLADR
jgi:carboxyl-terminal processing protease